MFSLIFLIPEKSLLASLVFSFTIEFSQLYQASCINHVRHTFFGGLILGFDFVWTDLICFTVGILLAYGIACLIIQFDNNKKVSV